MSTSWPTRTAVLYVGVTRDLYIRLQEHKDKRHPWFTARYNVDKLVYYEAFDHILDAIAREKQLKGGSREKKLKLILAANPHWQELAIEA